MESVDCVVVGAGVVGLAIARALALAGREVIVVEAAEGIGTGTSSRNSEVIHAGIYYPKGSLMARACVDGRRKLYDYCKAHDVPHRNCGKLIVATDESQVATLASIRAKAAANGVDDHRPGEIVEFLAERGFHPALQTQLLVPDHPLEKGIDQRHDEEGSRQLRPEAGALCDAARDDGWDGRRKGQ